MSTPSSAADRPTATNDGTRRHPITRDYPACTHTRAPRGRSEHGMPSGAVTHPAGERTTPACKTARLTQSSEKAGAGRLGRSRLASSRPTGQSCAPCLLAGHQQAHARYRPTSGSPANPATRTADRPRLSISPRSPASMAHAASKSPWNCSIVQTTASASPHSLHCWTEATAARNSSSKPTIPPTRYCCICWPRKP
jgi:hypothetical protein